MAAKKDDLKELISQLRERDDYVDQAAYIKEFPARKARYGRLKPPVGGALGDNLNRLGLDKLYSHQADAVQLARDGRDVVVVTETASGKTLCYNIPVLEKICDEPLSKAIYLFPTKALGQDQARALMNLVDPDNDFDEEGYIHSGVMGKRKVVFGTYDGDTPRDARSALRREASILLTNPDMLSLGILPNHSRYWSKFFKNLKYVVIDEIHIYRGVFGSHVGNLMRRLGRICEYHGARPQFICCSATIANPAMHASALTGRDVVAVENSGAPAAGRTFVLWNPPAYDEDGETRKSPITESVNLFTHFVKNDKRTIVFARARPTVEIVLRFAREKLEADNVPPEAITSYRGGYLAEDRRVIERELAEGDLLGVACTTALELGVDIGSLDVAIINGYPGSISSIWQQAGRAGRRDTQSAAFFVAHAEPLDQYLMRHPEYFFGRPVEQAIINPSNAYIQTQHVKAAALELPLKRSESALFGDEFIGIVRKLITDGKMKEQKGGAYWIGEDYPAQDISMRTASPDRFSIMTPGGRTIGEVDSSSAQQYLHDGAVYLHMAETYLVEQLDFENRVAHVERKILDYYTRSLSSESVTIDKTLKEKTLGDTRVFFGYVDVTSRVHSFKKIKRQTDVVIGWQDLDYPEDTLWTQALWFVPPARLIKEVMQSNHDLMGGLHAVEHASIAFAPFLAMCDRDDIGGLSTNMHPDVEGEPVIFIHDGHQGGVGLAEVCYERIEELLEKTLELVKDCSCRDGCPSCIQSPKCGNMNEPLDKKAALMLLKGILKG